MQDPDVAFGNDFIKLSDNACGDVSAYDVIRLGDSLCIAGLFARDADTRDAIGSVVKSAKGELKVCQDGTCLQFG